MQTYKVTHYKVKLVKDSVGSYPVEFITTSTDAAKIFHKLLDNLPHESMIGIFVSGNNKIIGIQTLSIGGVHGCAVMPCDVFRGAVACGASGIFISHNHPSGNPTPSAEDLKFTKSVIDAGNILGITVLDHLVVTSDGKTRSCFLFD
jgi:DNA repair protein RadC